MIAREFDDQGNVRGLFVKRPRSARVLEIDIELACTVVFAEKNAVIGRENDHRVFQKILTPGLLDEFNDLRRCRIHSMIACWNQR